MDNNFAEFLTTGGWNTPTHILERRLILSVVKVLCTGCTHSLHPHCTHKVENAKGKGCTCTRCTRGSGIPVFANVQIYLCSRELKVYLKDPYNYFDWIGLILTLLVIPLRFADVSAQWSVASLGYLFNFLRIFKFSCVTR
jgi:hypothetical protein